MSLFRLQLKCIGLCIFMTSMHASPSSSTSPASPISPGIISNRINSIAKGNPIEPIHHSDLKNVQKDLSHHLTGAGSVSSSSDPEIYIFLDLDKKSTTDDDLSSEDDHFEGTDSTAALELLHEEAENGDMMAVKYLIENKKIIPNRLVLHDAIESGNLELVKYILKHVNFWPTELELKTAALNGHLHIFKFLITEPHVHTSKDILYAAIFGNSIEIYKYLKENYNMEPDIIGLNMAIESGDLEMIKYIVNDLKFIPDINAANTALNNKMVRTSNFLRQTNNLLISKIVAAKNELDAAAKKGDLKLVKSLIIKKGVTPDNYTLYQASSSGNIALLKYLISVGRLKVDIYCIFAAVQSGNLEIVEFFVQDCGFKPTLSFKPTLNMVDIAETFGYSPIVEYLTQNLNSASPSLDPQHPNPKIKRLTERADHSLVENISFKESIRKGASRIRRLRNSRLKLSGSNFGDNFQELNDDYDSLDNSETSQSKSIDSKKLDRLHLLEKSNVGESYLQKAPHAYLENNLKNRLPVPLVPSFTSHKAKKTNKKIDENDDNMKLLDKQSLSDYDHVENQKSRKSISGKMFGLKSVSGYQRFGDDESA